MKVLIFIILIGSIACNSDTKKQVNIVTQIQETRATPNNPVSVKLVRPYKEEIDLELNLVYGSGSTETDGIISHVVIVDSINSLKSISESQVRGKIVVCSDIDMNLVEKSINRFAEYGAIACLVNESDLAMNEIKFNEGVLPIPVLKISNKETKLILAAKKDAPIQIFINVQ